MSTELPPPFNTILPPSYEERQCLHLPSRPRPTTSPRSTAPRLNSFQEYMITALEDSKGNPQAFLKLVGTPEKTGKIPTFTQGEKIVGVVELNLEKTEHVEAVTIEVEGSSSTLWKDTSPLRLPRGSWIKLRSWTQYALPPTHTSGISSIQIQYKLLVKFKVNSTISSSFVYRLRTNPSCEPFELRQLAYRQEREMAGPKCDPEGWECVGDTTVKGTVFDRRTAEVECLFYLAKPLSYARGGSIPFYISLSSTNDVQALDLFAARGSLSVLLTHKLIEHIDAKTKVANAILVSKGAYWPSEDNILETEMCRLIGEIPLSGDLKPSFEFENVSLAYHITFSLSVPALTQEIVGQNTLNFQKTVEICSYPAHGRQLYRPRIPFSQMDQTVFESRALNALVGDLELGGMYRLLLN
ncbi:hypothetical protein M422DRAFT_774981 [Sphaerobolus stellatus SS14]|nr:hypothetical protein M422DRAFT_774981 [Sphaerobolus stellatus SS14]